MRIKIKYYMKKKSFGANEGGCSPIFFATRGLLEKFTRNLYPIFFVILTFI